MSTDNKSIKFPAKHYVGFQARPSSDELPLGFMTPDGTDKAAVKRKETVDKWAKGYGYYGQNTAADKLPAQTYENKPLIGFKMGRSVRHNAGWGQGNVKWRIEDPRGFELEISSPNFAQLVSFCTIEKGEILEECIWARLGSENILVPVNSDVYENTVRNTDRVSKSASMRDIKIGDTAILHNGDEGVYYGTYYVVSSVAVDVDHTIAANAKKRHVFLMNSVDSDGTTSNKFIKAISSPKLSELFSGNSQMTHEEAEKFLNEQMAAGVSCQEATNSYYSTTIGLSIEPVSELTFDEQREETTYKEVVEEIKQDPRSKEYKDNLYYLFRYIRPANFFAEVNDKVVVIDLSKWQSYVERRPGGAHHHPSYTNAHYEYPASVLDKSLFEAGTFVVETRQTTRGSGLFRSNHIETVTIPIDVTINPDCLPLIRFKKTATTKAGTVLTYYR